MTDRRADVTLWSVLRKNANLVLLYGLGTAVVAMLWWPLALIYLGYCVLSIFLFIALICPYCVCYPTKTCPDGYHLLSFFKPKEGKTFTGQFRRYIFVVFPGWFVPFLVGLYLLFTAFSWLVLILMALFSLVGFVVLPYLAQRACATCKNARNCPRYTGEFSKFGRDGVEKSPQTGVTLLARLRQWIASPVFEGDGEKTRVARLLNIILFIVIGLVAVYTVVTLITDPDPVGLTVECAMILGSLGLRLLMRRGHVRPVGLILTLLLWGLITIGTYAYGGLEGSGVSSFFGVALIAGLLVGGRAAIVFAALSVLSAAAMLAAKLLGIAPPPPDFISPAYRWAEFSTTIVGVASLFYLVNRSLERALEQARRNEREAIEASEFKTRLIARISHELRTPLGAVLGLTEMLEDHSVSGALSPAQHEIAQKIVRNSHRLNRLVAQLLDQSRFESGRLHLKVESFSPRDVVTNVVAMMRPGVENKGLVLRMDIADSVPDAVLGDSSRVEQILHDLVDNAAKFTKVGAIDVRAYRSGDGRWAMQVADTGMGIPEAAREYVFEPFRQVDESVTREYDGIGLGLTIVRQLTALMGGEVTLASEVGKGSVFTVILPVSPVGEGDDV